MTKKRVYIDSCVLIAAFRALEPEVSDAALALFDDPAIEPLYSRITELEVMPKAAFNKQAEESEFYRIFFASAECVPCTEAVVDDALRRGILNGLGACDALHVACAIAGQADELVTSEKRQRLPSAPSPGIPIHTLRSN